MSSNALGPYSTATGQNSWAQGDYSTATRQGSQAIGAYSTVTGQASSASGVSSVALGYASQATEDNTLSVGNSGLQRRIVNVADGTAAQDAATYGQLTTETTARTSADTTLQNNINNLQISAGGTSWTYGTNPVSNQVNRNTSAIAENRRNIAKNTSDIVQNTHDIARNTKNISALNESLDELRSESRTGIAASAALVELTPSAPGKTTVNLGSAAFKDATAVGITAVHRCSGLDNLMLNTGLSLTEDAVLVRAGVSWEF